MSDHPKCIDISHWQDFPDFEKVKAAGVIAMIHKATEGTGYTDPNRAKNIARAMDAGIACCTYHWLKPGDAADQMRYYLDVVDPVPGERMVIDYEEDGCTLDDLHEAVEMLLADPRGLQVTVYSGHLLKEQLSGRDELLADNTDLWLAQYTTGTPTWPDATYPAWALWQYSESGSVDGIPGTAVDLDRFNGTNDELLQWISPAPSVPQPDLPEVAIDISVPEGVLVSIYINGKLAN
jgi:lysozyme